MGRMRGGREEKRWEKGRESKWETVARLKQVMRMEWYERRRQERNATRDATFLNCLRGKVSLESLVPSRELIWGNILVGRVVIEVGDIGRVGHLER